jgi:hypothetical protein
MLQLCGLDGVGNGKARRYPLPVVQALRERHGQGTSVSTTNHYLTDLKNFTRWLAGYRTGKETPGENARRILFDPLAGFTRQAGDDDIRLIRRALDAADFGDFLDAAEAGDVFRGLDGPDRAMLYRLASRSGLRAAELASLTPVRSLPSPILHTTASSDHSRQVAAEQGVTTQPGAIPAVSVSAWNGVNRHRSAPSWYKSGTREFRRKSSRDGFAAKRSSTVHLRPNGFAQP